MNKKVFILLLVMFCLIPTRTVFAMHISEGFLPAFWCVFWGIVSLPFLIFGIRTTKKITEKKPDTKMLLAIAGAFIFVLSALKMPSFSGSSSHPTGVGFSAIMFGPLVSSVLGLIALVFQTLLLAHGGFTTLGANAFAMAIAGPFLAYAVFKIMTRCKVNSKISIFMASATGSLFTYFVTSVQLALAFSGDFSSFWQELTKYSSIFAVTQIPIAVSEGILTVLIFDAINKYIPQTLSNLGLALKNNKRRAWLTAGLFILVIVLVFAPLYLVSSGEFGGADGIAQDVIESSGYEQWFAPLFEPASSEIESMLFALQAVLGAAVIFYFIGFMRGKSKKESV